MVGLRPLVYPEYAARDVAVGATTRSVDEPTGPLRARGDDVAGLNDALGLGLPIGLPKGRREGRVFKGVMIAGRFPLEASYATGANETFRGALGKKGDFSPVVMAIAGLKVVDLSLMSMISTDGLGETSSGKGESLKSREELRLRELPPFGIKPLLISGVVNSTVDNSVIGTAIFGE